MERGKIKERKFTRQIRDFSGLRFNNVTPTDIDGLIEFNNCIYILIEAKFQKDELPPGQERALINLVDTIYEASKKGLLIIATHNKPSEEDIPFHECKVSRYRSRKSWYSPKTERTVKELIDLYLKKNCIDCSNVKCSANIYVKTAP
jgi:hypothetical protein